MQDLSTSITGPSQHERLEKFTAATFLPRPKLLFKPSIEALRLRASTAEALFYFFSNQWANISQQHMDDVGALGLAARQKAKNILHPAKILDAGQALATGGLPIKQTRLKQLLDICQEKHVALSLIDKAAGDNLHVPSPFSDNNAVCQESYEINGVMCLRFTDGSQSFFLLQAVSSADSLYFPEQNILLYLSHARAAYAKDLLIKLIGNFCQSVAYAQSKNTFGGIIASHHRPAHFFYEIFPQLMELKQSGRMEKIPCLIQRQGQDFINLSQLFQLPQELLASEDIANTAFSRRTWFVHVGGNPHCRRGYPSYEAINNQLLEKSIYFSNTVASEKNKAIAGCYPIVWVGVEGQKRCWLEQAEGYAHILNQLARRYPQLGVIIDGWTGTYTPSLRLPEEVRQDLDVARQLMANLDPGIKRTVIVGENSNTKIFVGHQAHFFISNFASGSLHISHILAKPGFCHLSNHLALPTLHENIQIHPNRHVHLLPQRLVTDKPSVAFSWWRTLRRTLLNVARRLLHSKTLPVINPAVISYSIDKHQFWDFIEQRLDTVLNPPEPKLRLFMEPSFSIHYEVRKAIKMACYGNLLEVFPTFSFPKSLADLTGFSDRYLYNQVIYGVFPFGGHSVLNKPADYLLWLGDPLRRVLLHAAQFVKNAQAANQAICLAEVLTHGHKALDNYYTRQLSGMDAPYGGCHEGMLDQAIHNLRGQFIFIGINERQSESFDRLCQVMDWDRGLFPDQLPADFEPLSFSDAESALAQKLIHFDLRLYQAALAMTENA